MALPSVTYLWGQNTAGPSTPSCPPKARAIPTMMPRWAHVGLCWSCCPELLARPPVAVLGCGPVRLQTGAGRL